MNLRIGLSGSLTQICNASIDDLKWLLARYERLISRSSEGEDDYTYCKDRINLLEKIIEVKQNV